MKIGVDFDGVLYDSERYLRVKAELLDIENGGCGVVDRSCVCLEDAYGWSREQVEDFLNKNLVEIQNIAPILPFAKEVLQKLADEGHSFVGITNRGMNAPGEKEATEKRLAQDKFPISKVVYNQKNKLQACIDEQVDFMIDDRFENLIPLAKNGIKCLYLRAMPLGELVCDNVTEVQNWGEIYRIIKCFENKSKK